jgi:hypothetical protein
MLRVKNIKKYISLALAPVMLLSSIVFTVPVSAASTLGTPDGAKYSAVQLQAAPTKEMDYYNTQTPDGVIWVTESSALKFVPKAAIGDVTCAVKDTKDTYWVGTKKGLMRINFKESDQRDIVQYFAGPRYMYGGDDVVTGVALDSDGGVWVRNAKGSVHIRMPEKTMLERTYVYEKLINDVNDRRGMVTDSNSFSYDAATGEYTQTSVRTNDNDGLWTAMYAMGEIFRYQTLKDTGAAQEEIAAAKAAATRATKAVLLLDYVSGRGNGFPCRSYMLKDEAVLSGKYGNFQAENGFWFEKRLLNKNEEYPQPIIDEMKVEGKAPVGIATVRLTGDAMNKRGSQVLASSDLYNGLGLSPSSISEFNKSRSAGNKLGTDIVSGNGQVFPVMVQGVNTAPLSGNSSDIDPAKILFRLTTPVYERIPVFFNDLFPASAIGADGYVDDSQIVYKADTSSDEVDGHYALFLTAYKYLCDTAADAELKDIIVQASTRMTDLILKDDHYYIVDAHGKSTQWSRWLSEYFNDGMDMMKSQAQWKYKVGVDENGEDHLSYGFEDGPLNALEVMAALKTAAYITKDADAAKYADKIAKYEAAYDLCYESPYSGGGVKNDQGYVNGKGYIDMANEYIERRLIRQATDAYDNNDNTPVTKYDESKKGNKTSNAVLHNDWTQYVNYSDEELGWFPVYSLMILETNPTRKAQIVSAYDQWYENQEEREENPFYTFLYQLAHPEKTDVDLISAARYFYRSPQIRNIALRTRGDRQDVFFIEPCERDKTTSQTNYALPMDERNIGKNNGNPFTRYSGFSEQAYSDYSNGSLDCGTVFTLSYWFGRYYGMIAEKGSGDYYSKKAPAADITCKKSDNSSSIQLELKVTDSGTPISRVIADFYADGKFIGRARTDANGVAKLSTEIVAGTHYSATTTERLVGKNLYNTASVTCDTVDLTTKIYSYDEVLAGFSDSGAQSLVKQYVKFLKDPTYKPSVANKDAYVPALTNATTFVNAEYNVKPSIFAAMRNINTSVLNSSRTTLWLGMNDGVIKINMADKGMTSYNSSTGDLADNEVILLIDDNSRGVYAITKTGVSHIKQ